MRSLRQKTPGRFVALHEWPKLSPKAIFYNNCVSVFLSFNFRGAVPPGARFDPFGPPDLDPSGSRYPDFSSSRSG